MFAAVDTYTTTSSSGGGVNVAVIVIAAVIVILHLVGFWKALDKTGESGAWALLFIVTCLYPIAYLPMLRKVGRPGWWVILLYIPIVNFVVLAIVSIDVAKSFGRSTGYGVGLWLLPIIFWPMLGFGPATYQGPSVRAA